MQRYTPSIASSCGGAGLEANIRERLEDALGVDLAAICVHDDPAVLRRMRLPRKIYGGSAGRHVYVSSALARDERELVLAHEVFHSVEQANPQVVGACSASDAERRANQFARSFTDGSPTAYPDLPLVSPRADVETQLAAGRGFNAWEHRLLGDLTPSDLLAVAMHQGKWQEIVKLQVKYLSLWVDGVAGITRADIARVAPDLNVYDVVPGVIATAGELNALFGDYVITPDALQFMGTDILTKVLQEIRQESLNRLNSLIGVRDVVNFDGAVMKYPGTGIIGLVKETRAIEALTFPLGIDHYQGALARNACHFAPFGWFRWREFHSQARVIAAKAYATSDPTQKALLTNLAWLTQSCAEHFFQDAFAAGHLINKNLIMQWFAEWARDELFYVENWDSVRVMTAADQPKLAGRILYQPGYAGPSVDPQTVEELPSRADRVAAAPIDAGPGLTREATYFQYLDFLASAVIQLGSNQIHNHYNDNSLVAASVDRPAGFRIYGDESMLRDGPSVQIISAALATGRAAIAETLSTGATGITIQMLLNQLPTSVIDGTRTVSLDAWHDDAQKRFCETLFGGYKAWATLLSPSLGVVSIDQVTSNFGSVWDTSLPGADATVNVASDASGIFTGSSGTVASLGLAKGNILRTTGLKSAAKAEVRLDLTPATVIAGANGVVSSLARADLSSRWVCPLPSGGGKVSVLAGDRTVLSGSNGTVYVHDLGTGTILQSAELEGAGSYEVRLSRTESVVYAGSNGLLCALDGETLEPIWSASLTRFPNMVVNIAQIGGGRVAASCNGYISIIDVSNGKIVKTLGLPNRGLHEVSLAADTVQLYAGITGHLLAFDFDDQMTQVWDASLSALPSPVAVSVTGGSVTAATNGYLYSLDPVTGAQRHVNNLAGHGFSNATLTNNGQTVFCGIDAAVAAVTLV